jgi:hypothetical protein
MHIAARTAANQSRDHGDGQPIENRMIESDP